MSPGLKSRNLKGPVPTGLRFVGASRDLSPLKAWKRCLGMTGPVAAPQNAAAQNGVGDLKPILTVWLSTLSILTMFWYDPMVTAAVAGSITYSHVNTTSSAEKGWPSCQATFFLSFHVTDMPSFATCPFWRLGASAASTGTTLPSGSNEASGS